MNERVEAAAKAMHLDAYPADYWDTRPDLRYRFTERARSALAAADAVMFSDEAVERAAMAIPARFANTSWEHLDPMTQAAYRQDALSVIAALKGAGDE